MIGRNSIKSLQRLATIAYTSVILLLGWLGVVVGFGLLVVGILGVVGGQIIWSIAWAVMTAARGKLGDLLSAMPRAEPENYMEKRTLPDSRSVEQRPDIQPIEESLG